MRSVFLETESSYTYLSLEMLQSMTVFLLVLTIINGSWMEEFAAGWPYKLSDTLFLSTRFLKEICWNWNLHFLNKQKLKVSFIYNILNMYKDKMKSSQPSLCETRDKWTLCRDPDRSWCHRHTSAKLFWSQPMTSWTATSVVVIPAPVQVPTKRLLVPSFRSVVG